MITQKSKIKNQNTCAKFKTIKGTLHFALLIATLHFALCTLHLPKASASTASNNNFNIEIKDIDTLQKKTVSTPQTLGVETTLPEPKTEVIRDTAPLSFSLSATLIDFGPLSPNNPTQRNTTLSVVSSDEDYNIQVFEDHPLINPDNVIIADTTCDNGACSEISQALWISDLTYGLGFRCDNLEGYDCSNSTLPDFYKQLPDITKQENPQVVMAGKKEETEKKGQITLKLNTSGTQKPGRYSNTVTFIAVPNY